MADDPKNPAQWKAIGAPSERYPNGKPQQGRSYEAISGNLNKKFNRIKALLPKLPAFDKYLKSKPADINNNDTTAALYLMRITGIRVGDPGSKANSISGDTSYGATSILRSHVSISGDTVTIQFPGKRQKAFLISSKDPTMVSMFRARLARPGKPSDRVFPTTDEATTMKVVKAQLGKEYVNHDLRSSAATALAVAELKRRMTVDGKPTTPQAAVELQEAVYQEAAGFLNDDVKQAKETYVAPFAFLPIQGLLDRAELQGITANIVATKRKAAAKPEELHQGLVEAVAAYQKHLDSGGRDLEAEPK